MPLYIRCVLANKYTLAGYLLLFAGLTWLITGTIFHFFVIGSGLVAGVGGALLLGTRGGQGTMAAYRLVMESYKETRGVNLKAVRILSEGAPCTKAGVDLALRDIDRQIAKARQEPP